MYHQMAILALFIFFYSLVARRIEQTSISGPMVFVAAGLIMGTYGFGWFDGDATNNDLRTLADLTLALILFIDAANANMTVLKRQFKLPTRMLLLGLPGIIMLGFGAALLLFDVLSIFEAAILATMLAATDAALGKAVVTNKAVPDRIRESLNVESGLNDGICVPILLFFIALSVSTHTGQHQESALVLVVEEIGIGLIVGLGLSFIAVKLLRLSLSKGWLSEIWQQVTVVGLAFSAFAIAQSLHGSGYIAAFTGGLLFGYMSNNTKHELVLAAEGLGETLALLTWMLFGAMVIGPAFKLFSWHVVLYSILSLTVIRMLPIYLSLTGSGESTSSRLFVGWFGPRGLASIVFAIIVINANVPHADFLALVVICTVFMSLIAHGLSAKPLIKWLAKQENKK